MGLYKKGIEISRTIGGNTFYPFLGNTYVRKKSSLTRKRVLNSKEFENTRKCAQDLGRAAKIGSVIYKALPANIRERWLYRAITGEAASLLYEAKTEEEIKGFLWGKYIEKTQVTEEAVMSPRGYNCQESSKKTNIALREIFRERWEKQGMSAYYFKHAWQKRGYFNKDSFRDVIEHIDRPRNRSKWIP